MAVSVLVFLTIFAIASTQESSDWFNCPALHPGAFTVLTTEEIGGHPFISGSHYDGEGTWSNLPLLDLLANIGFSGVHGLAYDQKASAVYFAAKIANTKPHGHRRTSYKSHLYRVYNFAEVNGIGQLPDVPLGGTISADGSYYYLTVHGELYVAKFGSDGNINSNGHLAHIGTTPLGSYSPHKTGVFGLYRLPGARKSTLQYGGIVFLPASTEDLLISSTSVGVDGLQYSRQLISFNVASRKASVISANVGTSRNRNHTFGASQNIGPIGFNAYGNLVTINQTGHLGFLDYTSSPITFDPTGIQIQPSRNLAVFSCPLYTTTTTTAATTTTTTATITSATTITKTTKVKGG